MKRLLIVVLSCLVQSIYADSWFQKSDFGGISRSYSISFTIGDKAYVGLGMGNVYKKDFWEYDPATNTWVQKANFPGASRIYSVGFSIDSMGYVCTGRDSLGVSLNDLWQYNPVLNTWSQKANFAGPGLQGAFAFSIGNYGYVGTGSINTVFYRYDPSTDTWLQKASFPSSNRKFATSFTINQKGYVVGGLEIVGLMGTAKKDLWEYDPVNDVWLQKANLPVMNGRFYAVSFCIGQKGYVGTGRGPNNYNSDFYEYDPILDNWTQKLSFSGDARCFGVGFSIGNKGYIGLGLDSLANNNDLWEYTQDTLTLVYEKKNSSSHFFISPNPASCCINLNFEKSNCEKMNVAIIDSKGSKILSFLFDANNFNQTIDIHELAVGIYFIVASNEEKYCSERFIKD